MNFFTYSAASTAAGELNVAVVHSSSIVLAPLVSSHGMIWPNGKPEPIGCRNAPLDSLIFIPASWNSSHVQSDSGSSTPASSNTLVLAYSTIVLYPPGM